VRNGSLVTRHCLDSFTVEIGNWNREVLYDSGHAFETKESEVEGSAGRLGTEGDGRLTALFPSPYFLSVL
jgi:hypothetical protein